MATKPSRRGAPAPTSARGMPRSQPRRSSPSCRPPAKQNKGYGVRCQKDVQIRRTASTIHQDRLPAGTHWQGARAARVPTRAGVAARRAATVERFPDARCGALVQSRGIPANCAIATFAGRLRRTNALRTPRTAPSKGVRMLRAVARLHQLAEPRGAGSRRSRTTPARTRWTRCSTTRAAGDPRAFPFESRSGAVTRDRDEG